MLNYSFHVHLHVLNELQKIALGISLAHLNLILIRLTDTSSLAASLSLLRTSDC